MPGPGNYYDVDKKKSVISVIKDNVNKELI
jgi:hypothetical protein